MNAATRVSRRPCDNRAKGFPTDDFRLNARDYSLLITKKMKLWMTHGPHRLNCCRDAQFNTDCCSRTKIEIPPWMDAKFVLPLNLGVR